MSRRPSSGFGPSISTQNYPFNVTNKKDEFALGTALDDMYLIVTKSESTTLPEGVLVARLSGSSAPEGHKEVYVYLSYKSQIVVKEDNKQNIFDNRITQPRVVFVKEEDIHNFDTILVTEAKTAEVNRVPVDHKGHTNSFDNNNLKSLYLTPIENRVSTGYRCLVDIESSLPFHLKVDSYLYEDSWTLINSRVVKPEHLSTYEDVKNKLDYYSSKRALMFGSPAVTDYHYFIENNVVEHNLKPGVSVLREVPDISTTIILEPLCVGDLILPAYSLVQKLDDIALEVLATHKVNELNLDSKYLVYYSSEGYGIVEVPEYRIEVQNVLASNVIDDNTGTTPLNFSKERFEYTKELPLPVILIFKLQYVDIPTVPFPETKMISVGKYGITYGTYSNVEGAFSIPLPFSKKQVVSLDIDSEYITKNIVIVDPKYQFVKSKIFDK